MYTCIKDVLHSNSIIFIILNKYDFVKNVILLN